MQFAAYCDSFDRKSNDAIKWRFQYPNITSKYNIQISPISSLEIVHHNNHKQTRDCRSAQVIYSYYKLGIDI